MFSACIKVSNDIDRLLGIQNTYEWVFYHLAHLFIIKTLTTTPIRSLYNVYRALQMFLYLSCPYVSHCNEE